MFAGKPIIGITGGIGSGKSFVASLFGELRCAVIDADAQVRAAYEDPSVRRTLVDWWGDGVLLPDGGINRSAIARRVFTDPAERRRLENLLHPMVDQARRRQMENMSGDEQMVAFVWDTPLLFEAGLNSQCDAVVFVEAPLSVRLGRVSRARGWDQAELLRREKLQWPLDRKREIADYVIENTAGAGEARDQVGPVLSRILDRVARERGPA